MVMIQTKEILDLTDLLSEAVDTHDTDEALEVVGEIQHYLDANSVEDAAYYDAVDRLEEITIILNTGDLTSEQWAEVGSVTHQIDRLYLRHHREQDSSQQSLDELQTERDAFREKAIQYTQDIDELIDLTNDMTDTIETLSEELEDCTSKLERKLDSQKRRIENISKDLLGSDDDKIIDRLEEAKDHLQHGDNRDAKKIITDTRKKIENGEYHLTGYPMRLFVSELRMAETDAMLGGSSGLENLLSEYKNKSNNDR